MTFTVADPMLLNIFHLLVGWFILDMGFRLVTAVQKERK